MTSLLSYRFCSVQRVSWTRTPLGCLPTPGIGSVNPCLGKDCASQWLEKIPVGRSQVWEPKKQTLTLTYMAVVSYRHPANEPSQISHIPLWGAEAKPCFSHRTAQASTIRRLPDRSWRCWMVGIMGCWPRKRPGHPRCLESTPPQQMVVNEDESISIF